jgi:2'-5' RNA ligase
MKKTAMVYWLLPAKPERDLFCEIVRILRKEFGAQSFEPHLTLFVTTKDRQPPSRVLRQIRARPIRLSARGVGFSPKFTKTLYVRFKPNPSFRKVVLEVGRAVKSAVKAPADPHVSLLYQKLPHATKKELAKVIKLPFGSAQFNSIAAVRLTLPVRTGADVAKWKIVAKKSLRR